MNKQPGSMMVVHGVAGALCLALLFAGWWLGLRPVANQQNDRAALKNQVQLAEGELRKKSAELDQLGAQYRRARQQLENRPLELRPSTDLNAQIGRYSQLAERCGLVLSTSRVGDLVASGDHRYFPVTLGGTGPMIGVMELLGQLHGGHPDTTIEFIDMTRSANAGSATFELKLLWLVTEAPTSTARVQAGGE